MNEGERGGEDRERARELARRHVERGEPLEWFERLYAEGRAGEAAIPWADREPNPNLVAWLDRADPGSDGRRALKVGCGLGDDVEELSARGFDAVGFDVSPTAIEWARERFRDSEAEYVVADLFDAPDRWTRAFDLVVESYLLQVLPPARRREAVGRIAEFVAPGGTLVAIARGRESGDDEGEMPWPLTEAELRRFGDEGLEPVRFEDYEDDETPPVRRFRATFRRPDA